MDLILLDWNWQMFQANSSTHGCCWGFFSDSHIHVHPKLLQFSPAILLMTVIACVFLHCHLEHCPLLLGKQDFTSVLFLLRFFCSFPFFLLDRTFLLTHGSYEVCGIQASPQTHLVFICPYMIRAAVTYTDRGRI